MSERYTSHDMDIAQALFTRNERTSIGWSDRADIAAAIAAARSEGSDGYHTFDELYEHRHTLFIALCRELANARAINPVWRSRLHADGTMFPDWFVMGIHKERGRQITYHLPARLWLDTYCAETLDRAPEFDDHTSTDVLQRLTGLSG